VLKDCQEKGKIANLGTPTGTRRYGRFIDAGFDLVSAQVQYSLLDRRAGGALRADWGRRRDVQILCYGTLAAGS
jgi:aryl-alcohol dehydrogenase-like predicted oxidoreductase